MADRDPWFKFHPDYWLTDPELRSCSGRSRGALIDTMALLSYSSRYGFLVVNGTKADLNRIALQLVWRPETYRNAIQELLDNGVLEQDEQDVIYCPRMVSDWEKRQVGKATGSLGGNPAITGKGLTPPAENGVNPDTDTDKKQSKNKKQTADAPFVREFENDFWPLVRKKETRPASLRLFVSLRKKGVPLATLVSGLLQYQREKAGDDVKYLMQPAKFLGRDEHWKEWAEKAEASEAETQRAREVNERREKTVLKRTMQPTNPNPDMAKQLRELAKDLGEGKGVEA